ncbi:LysM peptidoglycan-binding domain-containing protein [Salibaculum halophilum]|uniref:LysM peptidoglycan-binding domain-containing protein n=1 Tax=Salibaculum halophilum TaxID=1914408 RepID=UPI001179B827|nr:LysM domain-containing protein [Salibaculum halophilum]
MTTRSSKKTVAGLTPMLMTALSSLPLQAEEYQVQAGDTLMSIARSELGSAARWRELCEINRDQLDDCDRILAGMTLILDAESDGSGQTQSTAQAEAVPDAEDIATDQTAETPVPNASENFLPNDSLQGATIGELGGAGSLPDHWDIYFARDSDGAAAVVDVTEDWIDLRITQNGGQGVVHVNFARRGSFVETTPNERWEFTADLAVVDDDESGNWQANLAGSQWRADGRSPSLGAFVFSADLPLTPEMATFTGTAVTGSPDAALVDPDLRLVSSGPWTATFRIGAPTFKRVSGD